MRALVVVDVGASGAPSARVFLADTGAFDAARYEADAPPPSSAPTVPAASSSALAAAGDAGAPVSADATSDGGMAAPPASSSSPPPAPAQPIHWTGAVASLERAYGADSSRGTTSAGSVADARAPSSALATSPLPAVPQAPKTAESRPFYVSPWFWGAVGAAVFGGVAVYFATRDNTPDTIHLELQVPK